MIWIKGSLVYSQAPLFSISSQELCVRGSLSMCLFKHKNLQAEVGRVARGAVTDPWGGTGGQAGHSVLLWAHSAEMLGDLYLSWTRVSVKQISCSRTGTEFRTFLCWANCSTLQLHLSDSSAAGAQRTQVLLKLANIYTSNFFKILFSPFNVCYCFLFLTAVWDCISVLILCLLFYFQMSFFQESVILAK